MTALGTGKSYGYDANGNTLAPGASAGVITRLESGSTYTQVFDTENRLTSVTDGPSGQVTTFAYDPDGNLVMKIYPDGSKTIYVGGIYEEDKTSGGMVTQTRTYYPAAGAMRVGSTCTPTSPGTPQRQIMAVPRPYAPTAHLTSTATCVLMSKDSPEI